MSLPLATLGEHHDNQMKSTGQINSWQRYNFTTLKIRQFTLSGVFIVLEYIETAAIYTYYYSNFILLTLAFPYPGIIMGE